MMILKTRLFKNIFFGFIILFLHSCTRQPDKNTTQHQPIPTKDTLTDTVDTAIKDNRMLTTVADIQKRYSSVIKQLETGAMDSTSFKYSCQGEKGGTVTYFTDEGQLRLVIHRYHEYDHYSAVDCYFVENEKLYFAHLKGISWSFDDGGGTIDNVKEQRIYVINQRPIRCLEKKYTIRSKASKNPHPESVANTEVDCKPPASIIGPYRILLKHIDNSTSGCLGH
jgi:hypothetical protein